MKRLFSLLTVGSLIAILVAFALAQVPVSLVRGKVILGATQAQIGSGLVLVEEHTASNSAALNFTTCISSTYDNYQVQMVGLLPATNGQTVQLQFSTNGGSSYDTGANYNWANWGMRPAGAGSSGNTGDTSIEIYNSSVQNSTTGAGGSIQIFTPALTAYLTGLSNAVDSSSMLGQILMGQYTQTGSNAFRIHFASGNITSGTVRCYGLAK